MAERFPEATKEELLAMNWKLDIQDIMRFLPHRAPFLLVDRVTGVEVTDKGEFLCGYKLITNNEPVFAGHFPGQPIFPGVMQIEALGQLGGLFASRVSGRPLDDTAIILMSLNSVKFRRPVVPGDRMDLKVWLLQRRGPVWKMGGAASVDGNPSCEIELLAFVGSRKEVEARLAKA